MINLNTPSHLRFGLIVGRRSSVDEYSSDRGRGARAIWKVPAWLEVDVEDAFDIIAMRTICAVDVYAILAMDYGTKIANSVSQRKL